MTESADKAIRANVRGSSLLLAGRFLSLGINFIGQILTVRYLSKADYGAFAYALSLAAFWTNFGILGLSRGVGRFIPIYQEREEHPKVLGAMILAILAIVGFGAALISVTVGFQSSITSKLISDPNCLSLVLILIALGPINALDDLFQSLSALFLGPKAIFFRRHIATPTLKVMAILTVMSMGGDSHSLAIAHIIIGCIGLVIYAHLLRKALRNIDLFPPRDGSPIQYPTRELFRYSLPLLVTDVASVLRIAVPAIALEYYGSPTDIATYRAVIPVAGLNLIVLQSFRFLYVPAASRFMAQGNHEGVASLYAKTAVWGTLLTYPVFLLTCALSDPITIFLFGDRYAESGPVLAILAAGSFLNASVGHNLYTLQVYARFSYLNFLNLLTAVTIIGLNVWLTPRYGAIGAAMAALCTNGVISLFGQLGLSKCASVTWISKETWKLYGLTFGLSAGLIFLIRGLAIPFWLQPLACALAAFSMLRLYRHTLDLADTFPELAKIPLVRFLSPPPSKKDS